MLKCDRRWALSCLCRTEYKPALLLSPTLPNGEIFLFIVKIYRTKVEKWKQVYRNDFLLCVFTNWEEIHLATFTKIMFKTKNIKKGNILKYLQNIYPTATVYRPSLGAVWMFILHLCYLITQVIAPYGGIP